jgi:hypothetical protein
MSYKLTDSTGNPSGGYAENSMVETITANRTLTAADAGKTFLVGTDALTITLPATIKGFAAKFINIGAAGNNIITVAPVAADGICGTITLAASVVTRVGTVNTALVNTKATSTLGNTVAIVGTGVTGTSAWVITESTGIWA